MDEGFEHLIQLKKKLEDQRKNKYKVDSKERLRRIIRKKIQTTMIGSLDTLEKHLGFLWEGDDKESKEIKEIYNTIRQEILDRGNDQIRNIDTELNQYDIVWLRYHLTIPIKRRNQENG